MTDTILVSVWNSVKHFTWRKFPLFYWRNWSFFFLILLNKYDSHSKLSRLFNKLKIFSLRFCFVSVVKFFQEFSRFEFFWLRDWLCGRRNNFFLKGGKITPLSGFKQSHAFWVHTIHSSLKEGQSGWRKL